MFLLKSSKRKFFMLLMFLILMVCLFYGLGLTGQEALDSQVLEKKILALGELTTLKYQYKNILSYKDSKQVKDLQLPFTTKTFLIVYEGYVKAGVDLKKVEVKISDEEHITIKLPRAQFTDNVIQEEDVVVYDEKSGLFNPIKVQEVFTLLEKEKTKTEKELKEKGFLQEANRQAVTLLHALFREIGLEDLTIEFR